MELNGKFRLLLYGPWIANRESDLVTPSDYDELPQLAEYMLKVMKRCDAKALSAPQVGIFKMFFMAKNGDKVIGLVNPSVERLFGKEIEEPEFDLSIPPYGNACSVPRMESIIVHASTLEEPDNPQHFKYSGRFARIVHHEIDHLTGTFFVDRVGDKKKRLVLEAYQQWRKKWESAGRPFPY